MNRWRDLSSGEWLRGLREDQNGIFERFVQHHRRAGLQETAELQFLQKVGHYLRNGFLFDLENPWSGSSMNHFLGVRRQPTVEIGSGRRSKKKEED